MSVEMFGRIKGRFASTEATEAELQRQLPGDDFPGTALIVESAITLNAPPDEVWPWLLQVGRRNDEPKRAGWYFPRSVEHRFPERGRALREVDPSIEPWTVGVPFRDWLGKSAMVNVAELDPLSTVVMTGDRFKGKVRWNWTLHLTPQDEQNGPAAEKLTKTRVHSRARIAGVKDSRFNRGLGKVVDWVVAASLQAGLNERLAEAQAAHSAEPNTAFKQ